MSPLPESVDIAFEQFVQALPEGYEAMACEFRAFARGRKIKSPLQLLQVVMLYCGVDLNLRGTAGIVTLKWTPMSRPLFWKNKLSPGLVSWPSREVHCMGSLVIQRLMKALVVVKMEVVVQTLA